MLIEIAGLYICSYLIGSVPTAYIVAKVSRNIDIRDYGSGNVGASNAFRHLGKWPWIPLFFFDVLGKGSVPLLAGAYLLDLNPDSGILLGAPLFALAGHNWSVFLKFQGGRGIAVVVGSLAVISPIVLAVSLIMVGIGWLLTRNSGLWVLIAMILLPVWTVIVRDPVVVTWYCIGALALVVAKRLLSNWTPLYPGLPRKKVLFNRLFFDRDVDDNAEWVHRSPRTSD